MRVIAVNMDKKAAWLLLVTIAYLYIPFASADPVSLSGRVTTERGSSGIPNLTVSLSPRAATMKPKMVTTTDNEGHFIFNDLENGQYFLEVSQGLTVLYSEVVGVPQQSPKEIHLNPR
jgi:hypothetical protein